MVTQLPTFNGYTVDPRLKQFRRVLPGPGIEFIDFASEAGDALLAELIAALDVNKKEEKEFLEAIWS